MHAAADSKTGSRRASTQHVLDRRFALAAGLTLAGICGFLWLAGWYTRGWISAWPRFADDAYYYLTIARNVVAGHGFTMDQLSPTNGFQPLWMWTLLPIVAIAGSDPHVLLLVVQAICVAIFATTGGLLCGLVRAQLGLVPAFLAGLLLLFPRLENVAISGLESALVLLVLVLLILQALRSGSLFRTEPRASDAWTGALVGLLMLARLDSVFIALTLAVYVGLNGLVRGEGPFGARVVQTARKGVGLFWPAVALVAPYLAWNQLAFGRLMPISGTLKTRFPEAGFTLTHLNTEHFGLFLLVLGAIALETWRGHRRDPLVRIVGLLAIGVFLHALFTIVYMEWAIFAWHFAALIPVGALGAAFLARDAAERLPRAVVFISLAALTILQALALTLSISQLENSFTVGAREGGAWVDANLPPDAVLGMKDSGIFSYFARRRVMNLDGVANGFDYANAVCHGGLEEFLRKHGVAYVSQHAVPRSVRIGAYETYTQVYPCHLRGGRDSALELRREREVFRGTPYKNNGGRLEQLMIWRLPEAQP